nr:integrase, catalytic region, zinc finger, CCHC-type, peptidase aspartic, catalytic [Tanacetum cinerariifolium]
MVDMTDFASWQQRIRLYCQGKKNGVNILTSIDEGTFRMGTLRETLTEGALHLGSERPRVYSYLTSKEKDRFVTAVKLNRGLRDSNYDQLYAYLKQHEARANENKMMLDRFTQHTVDPLALMNQATIQDGRVVIQNVQGQQNRGHGNNVPGAGATSYGRAHNRVRYANLGQARQIKCYNCNDPVYDETGLSYDSDILSEVHDHDHYQDAVCKHHEVYEMHDDVQPNYVVESHADYMSDSNMISYDQEVFYIATNSELNVSRFSEMHDAHTVVQARCLELEIEPSKLKDKIKKDDHDVMEQNDIFRVENAKVKQHYQELYDSIKITRAKHIDQTTSLLTENENLKVQINAKIKCVTLDSVTPKVLAPGMYAIDVELIPSCLRNNRDVHLDYPKHIKESVATLCEIVEEAKVERPFDRSLANNRDPHLDYLRHLKESVETIRDIVKEAKVIRPLDRSIVSAFRYTKHSQELLEYAIGTCCLKHMTGDRSRFMNFVKKFIGTVRFENDHFGAVMGYGDYVIGDSVISKIYYVEGLGHNLFFVGQFYDSDLEVTFKKHSCYVLDTDGVKLIKAISTIMDENLFAPIENDPFINIFAPEPTSEASSSRDASSAESTYVTQTLHHLGKWNKDHLENPFAPVDNDPFINIFTLEPTSEASSSGDTSSAESTNVTQTLHHLKKWSKDHPIDNVIGNPS